MRTHPILTALIGIYTKYLHSIVSPAVYISCDCKIVFLIIDIAMPCGRFGRLTDVRIILILLLLLLLLIIIIIIVMILIIIIVIILILILLLIIIIY